MEKKRISNFSILVFVILVLALVVGVKTFLNITKQHEDRLLYSLHTNTEFYAKRCYLEGKCENEVTIQTLYDNDYIKKELVNPVTKEVIKPETKITYKDEVIKIEWLN